MEARVAAAAERGGGDRGVAVSALTHADAVVDALWLATLQTICGRAAHELRGALNAVAVNLEVVRSRSAKANVPASTLAQYTAAASGQLEGVIGMAESLMSLVRTGRAPVDVGAEVARVIGLLAPAARSGGRAIELDRNFGGLGTTSASSSSARLAIGQCLMAATDASADVRCVAGANGERPQVRLEHGGEAIAVDAAVTDALVGAGIDLQSEPGAIVITFPR